REERHHDHVQGARRSDVRALDLATQVVDALLRGDDLVRGPCRRGHVRGLWLSGPWAWMFACAASRSSLTCRAIPTTSLSRIDCTIPPLRWKTTIVSAFDIRSRSL